MESIIEILPLIAMMAVTGAVAGILAGLLGVGGGIVTVPVLEAVLGWYGVDPAIRMHIAVATSLACIVPTSISSSLSHQKKAAVDFDLVKLWAPSILIGAVFGSYLASNVDSQVLTGIFGVVALIVAIKMLLPLEGIRLSSDVPRGIATPVVPSLIGTLSSMIGIGGGTLSVPAMTLMSRPIHRAVGTAAVFGLCISLPGAIGFIALGLGDTRLPVGSLGYVNLIGFALIAPLNVMFAPLGARIAHSLKSRQLSILFGVFLSTVALRMIYRTIW